MHGHFSVLYNEIGAAIQVYGLAESSLLLVAGDAVADDVKNRLTIVIQIYNFFFFGSNAGT